MKTLDHKILTSTSLKILIREMVPEHILASEIFSVCFVGVDGKYAYVNELFKKRLSFKYDDIIGVDALEAIFEGDHIKTQKTVGHCFSNPGIPYSVELRKPTRRNKYISTQWDFIGKTNEQGEMLGVLCIGYNTTQRTELMEKVESQNIRLSRFAQTITHNFKSSANNLSILLRMYTENLPEEERKNDFFDMMGTSIEKLERTIAHLNETININFNPKKQIEPVKLLPLVQDIITSHAAHLKDMDVDVTVDIPEGFEVDAIEAYLESVIHNLFTNTLKYRDANKKSMVRIVAEEDEYEKQISVEDNGLGIDLKEHGEKLFGMYRTFHGNENAVGMGLYLVKNQVEVMEGDISVESTVGEGTKFTVTFNKSKQL